VANAHRTIVDSLNILVDEWKCCGALYIYHASDMSIYMFSSKLQRTDDVVLQTLMCVSMVKYEMLGLAAKYRMRDVRGGRSAIKETVWSCFVQKVQLSFCVLHFLVFIVHCIYVLRSVHCT